MTNAPPPPSTAAQSAREILTRLRNERRSAYERAPIHVLSTRGPHSRTIDKVLKGIESWL